MEALIIAGFVLAVLALVLTGVIAGIVAYIQYKYVIVPWGVMRKDVAALAGKVSSLEAQVQRASVMAKTDEEIARAEARLNARQRARLGEDR